MAIGYFNTLELGQFRRICWPIRSWTSGAVGILAIGVLGLVGCARSPSADRDADQPREELKFVRGGIIAPSELPGDSFVVADKLPHFESWRKTNLTNSVGLIEFPWEPRHSYHIAGDPRRRSTKAPQHPPPYPLWKIPLENVRDAAAGGTWPDCVLQFSPDGRHLAIGSFEGWLRIFDCFSGETIWSKRLAEGMIKRLAWSPADNRLYAGEQSPDGTLWAFDMGSESTGRISPRLAWSVRLADQLESSRPPAHDRFGIYTLPAVYDLQVAEDGRVFVAGTHRWNVEGKPQSRSLLACYDTNGRQIWQFPPEKPSNSSWGLTFFAIDPLGFRVAFLATPGSELEHGPDARTATVFQLQGSTGKTLGTYEIQPLRPYFERVESWDSVSIAEFGNRAVLGLNDGRAFLFQLTDAGPQLVREIELATPELVGKTPIVASASYARFHGDWLCLQTQNTHIPFGNSQAANRPPIAHRGANTLTVCDRDGNALWLYRGPYALSGTWTDRPKNGQPRWLAVMCREQPGNAEPGNFGLLLFDLHKEGGGSGRLVYYYPTEGPAMFFADISRDGRLIATAETPTPTPDGRNLYGTYQVHIIH